MLEKEFLDIIIEELEIEEEIDINTNFRELEDWSSLMGFSLLALMSENFNKKILIDEFIKINTFKELFERIDN